MEVNSFHHQAVKDLAPLLTASAYSEDGLIEGYELPGDRFLVGVQWHPEMMFEKYPDELKLFRSFVEAAEKYQSKKELTHKAVGLDICRTLCKGAKKEPRQ